MRTKSSLEFLEILEEIISISTTKEWVSYYSIMRVESMQLTWNLFIRHSSQLHRGSGRYDVQIGRTLYTICQRLSLVTAVRQARMTIRRSQFQAQDNRRAVSKLHSSSFFILVLSSSFFLPSTIIKLLLLIMFVIQLLIIASLLGTRSASAATCYNRWGEFTSCLVRHLQLRLMVVSHRRPVLLL